MIASGFSWFLWVSPGPGFLRIFPGVRGPGETRWQQVCPGFSGLLRACTDEAGCVKVSTDLARVLRVFPGAYAFTRLRVYGVL